MDAVVDAHFADARLHARAVVLIRDGELVYERYADGYDSYVDLLSFTKNGRYKPAPEGGKTGGEMGRWRDTPLLGWSMTKSVVATWLGALIQNGALGLSLDATIDLPEWQEKGTWMGGRGRAVWCCSHTHSSTCLLYV